MDHVVYLDAKSKELELLLTGKKTMVVRGAMGRKIPYDRVHTGDILYFINNNAEGKVKAKGYVSEVFQSDKLTAEESTKLINENRDKHFLSDAMINRFGGKRYLIFIMANNIEELNPFQIDKSNFGNMDDWLLVEDINNVKL